MQSSSPPPWQPGDRVRLRADDWTVVQWTAYEDCEGLRVQAIGDDRSRTFLLPFDRARHIGRDRLSVVSHRAWACAFERLRVDAFPYGGLRHVPDTIDLLPYQLEPALAVLRYGYTRLLIADDVGMGKTIEAGLLLRELAEREDGFRGLILVPAGLSQQWADELTTHFEITAIRADATWLRSIVRELPADVNPWSPPGTYLASFDFIKRPECLRALEDARWNLLVVDEAHAATPATDRRAAIDALAQRSQAVVLLTATPPMDPNQFAALCRVGEVPGDSRIGMFQRRRPGSGRHTRRSTVLTVGLTDAERRMHRMLERYTTLVWREARRLDIGNGRLATIVLRKRALSSSASLELSLRRRQNLVVRGDPPVENQLFLPLHDEQDDPREDVAGDHVLAASVFADVAVEERWLGPLIDAAAAAARHESKARVLVRLLRRIRQPAIVFTEYRDTLEHLVAVLSAAGVPSCLLHGGLSQAQTRDALADFASGTKILLATDAAAEGLNLQRTCRVIVHFELPWNPARLLQRAGRIDRIGQRRSVHEIALVAADTAESLVLTPLARRAARWPRANGSERMLELLSEARVAEAVFEGIRPEPDSEPPAAAPCQLLDFSREAHVESVRLERRRALVRRLRRRRRPRRVAGTPITVVRSAIAPAIVLLYEQTTAAGRGEAVHRSHLALLIETADREWPSRPSAIKNRLSSLLPHLRTAVASTLGQLGSQPLKAIESAIVEARSRALRRDEAIRRSRNSAARQLVQAGLFEWRSHRKAAPGHERPDDPLEPATPAGSVRPESLTSSQRLRAILVLERR